ncbi:MAG: aminoglycoside phosphotransferase family protein, partial [Anaerolinea sp.]|nr:aminoglycoside phosphotransferase family protein [Anaerolinea sp.]
AEARCLIALMTHLPGAPAPRPLIVDDLLGWMLLPEHGIELRDLDAPHLWEAAARQYAAFQIASIARADALVDAGLPDLRGRRLFIELTTLFRHPRALNGLTEDEIDRLRRSSPRLTELYIWLETSGLPAALVHGDFHGGSIIIQGDRPLFVNWPHASIGLPFLDLTILLHDAGHFFSAEVVQRLRDAYLESWAAYGSPGRLRAIYALAQPLGYLHRAILENVLADQIDDQFDVDDVQEDSAPRRSRVAYWLRQMLAALGSA